MYLKFDYVIMRLWIQRQEVEHLLSAGSHALPAPQSFQTKVKS